MRAALLAALAVFALPSVAQAEVRIVARDVPLSTRALQSSPPPITFNMVGLHWEGEGSVSFRTRSASGRWSAWRSARPEVEDLPNARSSEGVATEGWKLGNPWWTGTSTAIQYRRTRSVLRLRAFFLWSPVEPSQRRAPAIASAPNILPRRAWNADEKIVRSKPAVAPALRYAVVHHTAGSNSYSQLESGAVVRGIEVYHVKGNGWDDIGYNFLVDRYGQVFEGRAGGIDKNVVGAHALGFNTGSVGIAVIGEYGAASISTAARAALVRLLAWRLDVAHVDPLAMVATLSGGNPRFRAGAPVLLRAISGHKDTGFTDCPGNSLYAQLPSIARAASASGLPKIYEPLVQGKLGGSIRFLARLSSAEPWTVSVTNNLGKLVASGQGSSQAISWSWSSTAIGRPFTWTIASGDALAASGMLGGAGTIPSPPPPTPNPTLLLSLLTANPSVIAPSADGTGATTKLGFILGSSAFVNVQLLSTSGIPATTLLNEQRQAGMQTIDWNASVVPDGRYTLTVSAKGVSGASASAQLPLVVDRSVASFTLANPTISPNGDLVLDTETFGFSLAASLRVRLELKKAGVVVASVFAGQLGPGLSVLDWNGSSSTGATVPDGTYEAALIFSDALGEVSLVRPLVIDTVRPELRLVDTSTLRLWLSEPAAVTAFVNGARIEMQAPAGYFNLPQSFATVRTLSAIARDTAGNLGAPISAQV